MHPLWHHAGRKGVVFIQRGPMDRSRLRFDSSQSPSPIVPRSMYSGPNRADGGYHVKLAGTAARIFRCKESFARGTAIVRAG